MTARQSEIAAEAYAASLLARSGYNVLVQYGANQPKYDLVAEKDGRALFVSVKGNQNGGWPLAVSHKTTGTNYHQAIDNWRKAQDEKIIFIFVQFLEVDLTAAPRAYVAQAEEIARHMKTQNNNIGHGALHEDVKRNHPKSKYSHKIPQAWIYTQSRIDTFWKSA